MMPSDACGGAWSRRVSLTKNDKGLGFGLSGAKRTWDDRLIIGIFVKGFIMNSAAATNGIAIAPVCDRVVCASLCVCASRVPCDPHGAALCPFLSHVCPYPEPCVSVWSVWMGVNVRVCVRVGGCAGTLREGDEILEVNNHSLIGVSREGAIEFLRQVPPGETVNLLVSQEPETWVDPVACGGCECLCELVV